MNRLFDETLRSFETPALMGGLSSWPKIEVTEGDKEIRVAAELPGMEEKDIEVLVSDGSLVIRGETKSEKDDKERQFSERFYGRFERRIPIDTDVDEGAINATFKNGLLTITVPRSERAAANTKRIPINRRPN